MRHDQRPVTSLLQCPNCKRGDCGECVDLLRAKYSNTPICMCTKKDHPDPMGVKA